MRAEFAIFKGNKLIKSYWSLGAAFEQVKKGQHVRRWITGYSSKGYWEKV